MKPVRRREFQRELVDALGSDQPSGLDDDFFTTIAQKSGWRLTPSELRELSRDWIEELIRERVLLQNDDGKVRVNPEPIVGESARQRLAKLPADAIDRGATTLLLVLYAANSFLFLVLSFFFLPDWIVKVLGSAAGVALALLGLKSLNPTEADSMSLMERHRGSVMAALSAIALLQAMLLGLGFAYRFRIEAIPGSTVLLDGKFFARTPDPKPEAQLIAHKTKSPDNLRPWLTPQETHYLLRWDTHEIRISKKWYVDDDGSQESVKNVWVNLGKLWNPSQAFSNWVVKIKQKPVFKISYGIQEQLAPTDNLSSFVQRVRSVVDDWDRLWLQGIGQANLMRYTRADPYIAALQVVQVDQTPQVEFQICDRAYHTLKALGPIPYTESPSDPPLNGIRENVFSQLLDELGIPERFKLSHVATLAQTLLSSVAPSAITPVPSPTVTPSELPSATPGPTATANGTPTVIPSPTPTPDAINAVTQLQNVATQAVNNNRLDEAVAVQQQLQATLDTVRTQPALNQTTELTQHLSDAEAAIASAIKKKGRRGRIYIHIANESQREPAGKLQDKLVENNQFVVVGIQNVGGRAYIPDTAEVRFFAFPEPATTKQSAETIVEILRNNGVSKARPSYVIPSERDKKESSDISTHFEIWFARDSFAEKD